MPKCKIILMLKKQLVSNRQAKARLQKKSIRESQIQRTNSSL